MTVAAIVIVIVLVLAAFLGGILIWKNSQKARRLAGEAHDRISEIERRGRNVVGAAKGK